MAHHLFLYSAWAKNDFYTFMVEKKLKEENYSWEN